MLEGSNEVRRGSIGDVLRGARAELVVWNAKSAGIEDVTNCGLRGSPTVVKRVFAPKGRATKAEQIDVKERGHEMIAEDIIAALYKAQPALEDELLRMAAGY
jgi:electron transfer flavoprotein beta subunit